jgi:predicted CXXCH cytochrome family protein
VRLRLRHFTDVGGGTRAMREELVDVESITIGRSSESVVFLPELVVALHHAVMHLQDGKLWVETVDGDAVRVNGRVASGRSLQPGDVIRVGHHELRVVPATDDQVADLTVDIDVVQSAMLGTSDLSERTKLGIERGLFARRPLAWGMVIGVLGLFLVAPLLAARGPASEVYKPGDASPERWESWASTSWSSGPVSSPHRHFADRCRTCHLAPFEAVTDEACATCHADEGDHFAADVWESGDAKAACTQCHHEHRGDAALLAAADDDAGCLECHAAPQSRFPDADLQAVGDFGDGHAQFRLTVPGAPGDHPQLRDDVGEASVRASAALFVSVPGSGLRFPHSKHLVSDLRGPDGPIQLECAICHSADDAEVTMQGMTFEERCSDCHALAFDVAEPTREVAHRDPELVRRELFEYYAARAARGEADLVVVSERRRPGREVLVDPNPATARWIGERAAGAEQRLLGEEGICQQCHVLHSDDDRITVEPVRVGPFEGATRWLPRTEFSHRPHRAADCNLCHAATKADSADLVMMPGIGVCRGCHTGATPTLGRVSSPCQSCHDYHHESDSPARVELAGNSKPGGPS